MRLVHTSMFAVTLLVLLPSLGNAQAPTEASRNVAGGGISVPGWVGKIDANAEKAGQTVNDAKLTKEGGGCTL